jgi:hypothetical protein
MTENEADAANDCHRLDNAVVRAARVADEPVAGLARVGSGGMNDLLAQWELMRPGIRYWHEMTMAHRGYPPGRNALPEILCRAYYDGLFDDHPDALAVGLEDAWTSAEYPEQMLAPDDWVDMFAETGRFLRNGIWTDFPDRVPVLYRAATLGTAGGMSWTDDLETARHFRRINQARGREARIYRLDDPEAATGPALAHFHDPGHGRGEHEWVLNTWQYTIDAEDLVDITADVDP